MRKSFSRIPGHTRMGELDSGARQRAGRTLAIAISSALLLNACTMAPRYERPDTPVPEQWPAELLLPQTVDASTASDIPWQSFVRDEKLRVVVTQALDGNRDLRAALASIEAARAQYRIRRADLLPAINASVNASRGESFNAASGVAVDTELYSANLGLSSFEIDLFGKRRSLSQAALQSYLATEQGARATRISLIAETISAYLTLAADNTRLALSERTLEVARNSMELTAKRQQAGVASRLELRQAETIYQQARADLAMIQADIAQDINALRVLVGSDIDPTMLPQQLPATAQVLDEVPAGLSSATLLSRPDVLQAEHQLRAANANIGAARAAFFPTLSLTATTGRASTELEELFSNGVSVWSVAPNLVLPIFSGGANMANLAQTQALRDQSLAQYERTIQGAFKEVADALAVRSTLQERLAAQRALVEAAADSHEIAKARYEKGLDSFLQSLDSQRTLYNAEKALVTARLLAADNLVTLYRALGGGLADEAGE